MARVLDERNWDGHGIVITRNPRTVTITVELPQDHDDSDLVYDEREIPLADFCKALGLQPIKEG